MTQQSDPGSRDPNPAPDSAAAASVDDKSSQQAPILPTLVCYFGPSPVSAPGFVKAVKAARISRFPETDIRDAEQLMLANDVDASRLCALISQTGLPDAIERWLWPAVQQRLKIELPAALETIENDAGSIFKSLHTHLSSDLSSSDKRKRNHAEGLLRITLAWLVTQRSLGLWAALEQLASTYFRDASASSRAVRRILTRGRIREIKGASGVAGFAQGLIRTALLQQDQAERRQISLQSQLTSAQSDNAILQGEKSALQEEIKNLTDQLASAQSKLDESKQHWGHDIVDAKARQNTLLKSRLLPLLNDAVDALEMQPSAPQISLKRLKAALRAIEEATL